MVLFLGRCRVDCVIILEAVVCVSAELSCFIIRGVSHI